MPPLDIATEPVVMQSSSVACSLYWQVNLQHLTKAAQQQLAELIAKKARYEFELFELFTLPSQTDGKELLAIKLLATPWTDARVKRLRGLSVTDLYQWQLDAGLPESLLAILHLAARDEIGLVVFEANAQVIAGLSLYLDK